MCTSGRPYNTSLFSRRRGYRSSTCRTSAVRTAESGYMKSDSSCMRAYSPALILISCSIRCSQRVAKAKPASLNRTSSSVSARTSAGKRSSKRAPISSTSRSSFVTGPTIPFDAEVDKCALKIASRRARGPRSLVNALRAQLRGSARSGRLRPQAAAGRTPAGFTGLASEAGVVERPDRTRK